MKRILSILALALAVSFSASAQSALGGLLSNLAGAATAAAP